MVSDQTCNFCSNRIKPNVGTPVKKIFHDNNNLDDNDARLIARALRLNKYYEFFVLSTV